MEGFKEFQGKDLDAAIREACEYYAVPREKLEIEIVQDAKSGIFGIVGARKAKIQARRAHLRETLEEILGRGDGPQGAQRSGRDNGKKRPRGGRDERPRADASVTNDAARMTEAAPVAEVPAPVAGTADDSVPAAAERVEKPADAAAPNASGSGAEKSRQPRENRPLREDRREGRPLREDRPRRADKAEESVSAVPAVAGAAGDENGEAENRADDRSRRGRGRRRPERGERPDRPERSARPERAERPERMERAPRPQDSADDADESAQEGFRVVPLAELDAEALRTATLEVVSRLITPVVDDVNLQVELTDSRVNVMVDCGDASGLLIGREGQTLAALQYLASRIVSRRMDAAVRVHLDAGAYRQRQDEKLREMALALAERVRTSGRSCSTRPLSSYHRRIVHLALQDMEDIQTRSSGDGSMKRVVILRKKQTEKTEKIAD